jgi:hypothetical protein
VVVPCRHETDVELAVDDLMVAVRLPRAWPARLPTVGDRLRFNAEATAVRDEIAHLNVTGLLAVRERFLSAVQLRREDNNGYA